MSHHHQKYYERPDGYVYSNEELDAYRVPSDKRDRCVNLYVPFLKCAEVKSESLFKVAVSALDQGLDNWGNECYKEKREYIQCAKTAYNYSLAIPTRNVYSNNPWLAQQESVSSEFEKNHFNSPMLY